VESDLHGVGHFAFYGVRCERGFGVGIVDLVAVGGEDAARVGVGDDGEDVVGRDGEEGVVEAGRHCCGCCCG
jgi:hypothetical protein